MQILQVHMVEILGKHPQHLEVLVSNIRDLSFCSVGIIDNDFQVDPIVGAIR